MKFKAGISGLENEVCRQLQSLLAYHHSIEARPICSGGGTWPHPPAALCGLDFVFCTYRPDSAQYSASIRQAVCADIPVVAFGGNAEAKLPVLKIDCISGTVFCKNAPVRAHRRGICIMSEENCGNSAEILIKLAELAIRRAYLTQIQSKYYP